MGGPDISAHIEFGWRVDYQQLKKWMEERGFKSCESDGVCTCGPRCWGARRKSVKESVPRGWTFARTIPHPCRDKPADFDYFLTLKDIEDGCHGCSPGVTLSKMNDLLANSDLDKARAVAMELGCTTTDPEIFAAPYATW